MLGFLTGVGRQIGSFGEDAEDRRALRSSDDCPPSVSEQASEEMLADNRRRSDQGGLVLTMAGPQMILMVRPERGASVASAHFDHR